MGPKELTGIQVYLEKNSILFSIEEKIVSILLAFHIDFNT